MQTLVGFMVVIDDAFAFLPSLSLQMTDNDNSLCDLSFVVILLITCRFNCLIELPFVHIFYNACNQKLMSFLFSF